MVEPLLLRDVYGLSYEEIAQQVGVPLGTIKAQIHHGRKLVRPLLAASEGDLVRRAAAARRPPAGRCSPAAARPCPASAARPSSRPAPGRGRPRGRRRLRRPRTTRRLDVALSEPVEDSVLPRRRRPRRRRAALRPGARVGAPDSALLSGDGDDRVPGDARRRRGSSSTWARHSRSARSRSTARSSRPPTTARTSSSPRRWSRTSATCWRSTTPARPSRSPRPTTRGDFSTTGFTITPAGETWTMQEPYGAHTWYPVNDQPSDKALYDFTLTVPSPVGRRGQRRARRPDRAPGSDDDLAGTSPSRRRRTSRRWPSATTR